MGQSDGIIRLAVFAGVFVVMALIELLWPKRKLIASKRKRWLTNIGISAAGTVLLRLMAMLAVPIAAIAAAFYVEAAPYRPAEPSLLAVLDQGGDGAAGARPRHLGAASGLAQDPGVLAAASGASRRPRHRRDHGGAVSPGGDRPVHAVEDRGGGGARRVAAGGIPVRGDPQRLRHVQSRQYRAAARIRRGVAAGHRDAGHASGASLGAAARARFQLRLQSLAVGSAVPNLHGAAGGGTSGHDHRAHALSERGADAVRLVAMVAVRATAPQYREPQRTTAARRSSSGSSAGTALRSARWHGPARARS